MGLWSASSSQERVNQADFEVEVNDQSVTVHLNASKKSPRGRLYWGAFFVTLWIAALCVLAVSDGKHGEPSMRHALETNPVNSQEFIASLAIMLGVSALLVLMSWRYVVMAYPSDEIFYCDRSILKISKVRWLDMSNKDWQTRSYPLDKVKGITYRAVARSKDAAIYGLRFQAAGRSKRVLPGLGTHDAGRILKAVQALGGHIKERP